MALYPKMTLKEAAQHLIMMLELSSRASLKGRKNMDIHAYLESDVVLNLQQAIDRTKGR